MSKKGKQWCAVPECMTVTMDEKRHFFRFPKEHDRWLKWIEASKRLDLELKSPDYAYRNCTICHLHFEEKWLIRNKPIMRLHPDAIPTVFFGPAFDRENRDVNERPTEEIQMTTAQEGNRSDIQCVENLPIHVHDNSINNVDTNMIANNNMDIDNVNAVRTNNMDADKMNAVNAEAKQSTSSSTQKTKKSSKKSPRKEKLLKQVIQLRKQNNRLRQIVKRLRIKQEKKKTTEKEVNDVENMRELSGKLFSGNFLKLLSAQIDALTKNKRGRRYDSDFKQFALSLFFSGPRNYRELIKHFSLPSVRSLQLFTQSWKIVPGINDKIFEALNEILLALPPIERHCILTVDEISLKSHLFYNISEDEIIGFEDTGYEKSHKPARSALVLMARSIAGNWKFPVCFCLIETACQSNVLKKIIFDIIVKLRNSNAIVHALVSDMGSNFKQLSRELGISTENTTFLVNGEKVLYIFDTPHLIKALRNNLLNYNFLFDINKIVSWKYIVDFYNKDSKQWIKMAPNLSKCHLEPNSFQRMKVKYAVQIFSNRVAAGMCTQMSYGFLPSEAVGTIDFIEKMDKLFDILNSSSLNNPKEYGKVYTGSEKQIKFLEQMLHLFKDIKVIDANGAHLQVKIPCFERWQITIKSIMQLWDTLKSLNFPYLRTRKINQDCVENFFGSIRQQGGNSLNPTPIQFVRAFKKLLSTKFLQHSESQNCAQDSDQMLNIMKKSYLNSNTNTNISPSLSRKILDIPSHDYYSMDLPEQNAFTYVCGYLIKKCLENHSCDACITYVNESKAVLNDTTLYCSFRAYSSEENNLYGNLHIPTNTFCSYIHQLEELFVKNFENNCFKKNIGNYLFQLAQTIAFKPPCSDFPTIFLIKLFLRMRIYFMLSQHNKSCKKSIG